MKSFLTIALLLSTINIHSQNEIVAAEYFFGNDPGMGNATALNVVSSEFLSTSYNIPTDDLETGLNVLYIRVKNNLNRWSLVGKKVVYTLPPANINIVAAEYYFNEDPGFGAATPIAINSANSVNQALSIPIPNNLATGVNKLYLRVKRADGRWSLSGTKIFYLFPPNLETEIVAAEYYFDADPGFGDGFALSVPNASSLDLPLEIPVPVQLAVGDHQLCIRVKNSNDKWSLLGCKSIQVQDPTGINDLESAVQIFPNPTNSLLHFNSHEVVQFARIINMKGEILQQLHYPKNVDLGRFASGNYLIQLTLVSGKEVSKMITKQ